MRQYVIDELRKYEVDRIRQYLEKNCEPGGIDRFYWLRMPDDMLTQVQYEHKDCAPFCSGIEVTEDSVIFEMLVRSRKNIRCSCVAFATDHQRQFILNFVDRLLKDTEIPV